jgi:curved DNA-binding protein CbpA
VVIGLVFQTFAICLKAVKSIGNGYFSLNFLGLNLILFNWPENPSFFGLFFQMTAQHDLDLKGILRLHPLAELLVEISQAGLNGSLRLANGDQKIVVYFSSGEVVYAISNARAFRLFDLLLRLEKIDKDVLATNPNYTNDLEFARSLTAKGIVSAEDITSVVTQQIGSLLKNALSWPEGEWIFSPLARLKDGVRFQINMNKLLVEFSRTLTGENVIRRFKSVRESFRLKSTIDESLNLLPHEAFILTRFGDSPLHIEEVITLSGMPDAATFQTLYTLWLGGLLTRTEWNAAFSEKKLAVIKAAKLELKKEAAHLVAGESGVKMPAPVSERAPEPVTTEPVDEGISLTDYLMRSEGAKTHYEMLGIEVKAEPGAVKQAYFSMAKRFHPDHFHNEADTLLVGRVQNAFTKLAQAYDVLKNAESREGYDFRMRRELAEQEKRSAKGASKEEINRTVQAEQAAENFEQGFSLLMDEEYEAAMPFLARAVFFAQENPRYHAYYGKALSFDENQRHKAESEMQTAIKLDSTNPTFRIILAEFFIQMGMFKRADGELTRLLSIFPSNHEARTLLDSLRKK